MSKTFTITIPEPCHEDWNQMTPKAKGRFCDSCAKVVVDFSNKSDTYIAKYLNKQDNLCGRFKQTQLNRPITLANKRKALLPPLAASFILPLALLATTNAFAQGSPAASFTSGDSYKSINIGVNNQAFKDIKGVIKDSQGNPLAGVRIQVIETKDQIQSDAQGQYRLRVKPGQTLLVSYIGFWGEQIVVSKQQDLYSFVLTKDPTFMEEVVITAKPANRYQIAVLGRIQSQTTVTTKEQREEVFANDSIATQENITIIEETYGDVILTPEQEVETTSVAEMLANRAPICGEVTPASKRLEEIRAFAQQINNTTSLDLNQEELTPETPNLEDSIPGMRTGGVHVMIGVSIEKSAPEVTNILGFQNSVYPTASRYIPQEEIKTQDANTTEYKRLQWEQQKAERQKAREARKKNN